MRLDGKLDCMMVAIVEDSSKAENPKINVENGQVYDLLVYPVNRSSIVTLELADLVSSGSASAM